MLRLPFLLRLALTRPHPQDREWATLVTAEGAWDPEWVQANIRTPAPGLTIFPYTPRLTTPQVVAMIKDTGMSRRTLRFSQRQMRLDQARWPKLFAALSRPAER